MRIALTDERGDKRRWDKKNEYVRASVGVVWIAVEDDRASDGSVVFWEEKIRETGKNGYGNELLKEEGGEEDI